MTSTIPLYSATIDVNYPVAGINQSSQGFRSNFAAIKSGFDQAASEVSNLQGKIIVVSGDVSGTSIPVGSTNAPITLSLVLPNITTAGTINSLANNVVATVNTKGQITSLSTTPISTNVDINLVYGVDVSSMGNGTGTANFPSYKFDAAGKVVLVGTRAVTFGVLGHPANKGKVVAGDLSSKTALTPAPSVFDGSQALMATGNGPTGLEWVALNIPAGTVVGVTAGPGIYVTPSSANPTISLDVGSLPITSPIADVDSIPFYSVVNADSEQTTVADFKTFIAADFLRTDLGTQIITSSDAGGVKISSAGGITLNTLKWPTTIGTTGQVLTISGTGTLAWSGSSNATVAKTFYVSDQYGSDTTGTGGLTTPYKTIGAALTVVPSDGVIYTVALLSGTYLESFTINAPNVSIKGVGGVSKPILKGVVTIGPSTNFVGLENLKLDRSDQPTTDDQPALLTNEDLGTLQVLDCDFIRGSGAKAQNPIITLTGNLTKGALFDGCAFQGQVEMNLVGTGGVTTVISNVRQLGTREWSIVAGASLTVNNVPVITGVTHSGGDLVLENIGSIHGRSMMVTIPDTPTYSWGVQVTGDPDYEPVLDVDGNPVLDGGGNPTYYGPGTLTDPVLLLDEDGLPIPSVDGSSNILYQPDGVTPIWETTTGKQLKVQTFSTPTLPVGIYSTAATGSIKLYDVSMFDGTTYAPIYKTDAAAYLFSNVDRRGEKDIIVGSRITFQQEVDVGDFMPRYEADFAGLRYADDHTTPVPNGKLDPNRARTVHVTLVGANAHLSIMTPSATTFDSGLVPASSEFVTEFRVFVQQDATGGRHLMWSTDSEPEILWYNDYHIDDAPNAISVFTFRYHSVARQWIGMRISKAMERRKVFTSTATTFVPTLTHANGFITINNASAIAFQINSAIANFPIGTTFEIEQAGVGAITVTGLGTQTVVSRGSLTSTAGQYAVVRVTKRDTTTWVLSGDRA
jgi:hypothetical protein